MLDTKSASDSQSKTASAVQLSTSNGLATITIDVPDSKVNTLSRQSMTDLNEVIEAVSKQSSELTGLVIRSGKADNFIAGADVVEIRKIQSQTQVDAFDAAELGKEVFAKIEQLPIITVAAINGICLGGGMELTLACKYRVASTKAKIGLPEVKLGLIPGWGGCVRLPRLIGLQKALELIMAAKVLDAKKAWRYGIVSEVVEPEQLLARSGEIAGGSKPKTASQKFQQMLMQAALETTGPGRSILQGEAYKAMMRETKGKYPAPKEALKVVMKSVTLPAEKAYKLESQSFSRLAMTNVSRNLVGIFFAQTDSKRLPADAGAKKKVQTVGVLGAGVMGAGIAQAAAKAGYKVVVKDVEQKFLDKGLSTIKGLFDSLVEKKRVTREEADKTISDMKMTTAYEDLAGCDLVIEAVLEDLKIKQTALAELEKVCAPDFVFATNTSSLSVNDIANGAKDPSRVVGLHFFNPVHKMPLVEVVKADKTSDAALGAAMSVALKLDKTTVITKDAPGFVVNRLLAPYLREAAVLAEEGVAIEDIDKAMKSFGMPMGPFALLDEVGLDISAKVIHVLHDALGERLTEPPLLKKIEGLKILGKKGGKGIYLYNEKGKPDGVNPEVQALITAPKKKKLPGEIQDRLVLLMLNEAARCLEEKVVDEPAQLDLALIFGTGFPPFLGGILRYSDSVGITIVRDKLDFLSRAVSPNYKPCALIETMAQKRSMFYNDR